MQAMCTIFLIFLSKSEGLEETSTEHAVPVEVSRIEVNPEAPRNFVQ